MLCLVKKKEQANLNAHWNVWVSLKVKKNQPHRNDKQSKCDIDEEGMKEERSRSSISGRHVCAENKNWQCYPVTLW